MPHVEVLPNSTSISAPGWAYVPDTGFDPSKAAIQPSGARKRNARTSGLASGDTTQKQNAALVKRLADLDRDNFKDAQITIPSKKDAGGRGKSLCPFHFLSR
jgi:zinc finger HIT domain-containing protein 1